MRVAILCPDASSNSLVRMYPIAKVLGRRHDVQVLGFRATEDLFEPYRDEFEFDTLVTRQLPRFIAQVREMARKVRADAVYAFKPLPSSFWTACYAKYDLGIPLFLDVEDWEAGWYQDVAWSDRLRHLVHVERPNGLVWTWLTEKLAGIADGIFVVSRFLQRRFGGTLLVHGADTAAFDPEKVSREWGLRRLGLPDGRYVVFTGSPMPNKGLDDLLSAVAGTDRGLKVVVVGSFRHNPAYRERLLERYGDALILMGPRPHGDMPSCLAIADMVVIPQRVSRETVAQVPGKVFEAMAMARPIVATTVSDLPEILDGCGYLVPPESVEHLSAAIDELLANPSRAKSLGSEARRRCQELYSWDAMERVLHQHLDQWESR